MQILKKSLLSLALFSVAAISIAATTASIVKTATPGTVNVTPGDGNSYFNISSKDFPSGALTATKTLLGIDWKTTYYPKNTETIQLCYVKPYQSSPTGCISVARNSSGTTTAFNGQQFGNGSSVRIIHSVSGSAPAAPLSGGTDQVTFRYSY